MSLSCSHPINFWRSRLLWGGLCLCPPMSNGKGPLLHCTPYTVYIAWVQTQTEGKQRWVIIAAAISQRPPPPPTFFRVCPIPARPSPRVGTAYMYAPRALRLLPHFTTEAWKNRRAGDFEHPAPNAVSFNLAPSQLRGYRYWVISNNISH